MGACIALYSWNTFAQSGAKTWVGTWAAAPYAAGTNTPPAPGLANNTFRQIVRVSIGGDTLRVRFSNKTCGTAVTMTSVNIAVSPDATKSAITASTMKQLKFGGSASVTMNAGATATSDPIAFPLTPNMRLAITTYYGQCQTSADMTHHYGSRTNSYILTGDQTASAGFTGATAIERWYHINSIEVLADSATTHSVVCFGNSITDGYGLTGGLENRWTDMFSQALLNNAATARVGVLNMGIGGTNVAGTGATTGATRYQQDVLAQSGVHWVIIFYGINDICASNSSAATITAVYQKMITDAHALNLKVYGATITPVNGNTYYSSAHEAVRSAVNAWIRTSGHFDAFFDFDKTIRDPADTTKLQAVYSNDWLHPNAAGYKLLGESIPLNMFLQNVVKTKSGSERARFTGSMMRAIYGNEMTSIGFDLPRASFVSLKVYSTLGKEIAELGGRIFSAGRCTVSLNRGDLAPGMYIGSLKIDNSEVNRILICRP
jgi:lysophospholipase L1-like esterase